MSAIPERCEFRLRLRESADAVDDRPQAVLLDGAEHRLEAVAVADSDAAHRHALAADLAEIEVRRRAREKADEADMAAVAQAGERLREGAPSADLDDAIHLADKIAHRDAPVR